ncbi:hypothetical protein [uncultured Roseobacter sp.]|uniref:hypothetical protein n=1 Tax=uncultured Roseobacter sp. TaxID=114847 RepID=UPI00262D9AFB|nr:hypothetical protein [uncultured Roseobacter sp.]
MSATDLQYHFHNFAGGRPALAFSRTRLEEVIAQMGNVLAGVFPDAPHSMMRNAKLPVYDLAYSGFVRVLRLDLTSGTPTLESELTATVHPYGDPSRVIATYDVSLGRPLDLYMAYSEASRELRWASTTSPLANVSPSFTADAEMILKDLGVPEPVLDTYERKVETTIVWNTSNTFVPLVLNALPPVDLGEVAPWLTLLDPLHFDFGDRYVVVTSDKVKMTIGGCSLVDVIIEPDPDFPYSMPDPVETSKSSSHVSVYLPKTRLVEFVANNVLPAIMYDTGNRGGIVKWRMNGAFGLKKFTVDVSGGVQVGNPWSGNLTLRGTLSASTAIALTGVARAWIDGPCGARVGLASASIQGDGAFAADIALTYQSPGGPGTSDYGATLEAELIVTRSELDPSIDIDLVGWPIDDIIGELVDHLVAKEIHKLSGIVRKLGKWNMLAVPAWLVDILGDDTRFAPVVEALAGVSTAIGITENRG